MKKIQLQIQLQTVQYPPSEPQPIIESTIFELGARVQGVIQLTPKQPLSCDSLQIQLQGKIQGSKVTTEDIYSHNVDLQTPNTFEANLTSSVPFQLSMDLPASSFVNKRGSVEYQIICKVMSKGQALAEQKIPVNYIKRSNLLKSVQAPLAHVYNKGNFVLYLQAPESILSAADIFTGSIQLMCATTELSDVEIKIYRHEQIGLAKEQQQLMSILLCEQLKNGDSIPFCIPLGGLVLQPTLNFQQIFMQTRLGISFVAEGKKDETQIEIIIRE
ncbi:Vacuolar_protein [Hexamita inflata]|uniref:Vacuolar protein n=1 Tax=Hexamita inflata TaxID=28002 RepID=A0AA86QDI3_9EUKA|nr:Vacuolar protein [Hexamita inflata]